MLHCSTSPYFSKRRVTSSSLREGWMPVTKRFEPELRLSSSSSSLRGAGGGPLHVLSASVHYGASKGSVPATATVASIGRGTAGT
jgi:hypothetical protein